MSADLTHATQWVFDLDNTLYPAECNLFDQIDIRFLHLTKKLAGIRRERLHVASLSFRI